MTLQMASELLKELLRLERETQRLQKDRGLDNKERELSDLIERQIKEVG